MESRSTFRTGDALEEKTTEMTFHSRRATDKMEKFMLTLRPVNYDILRREAEARGISIQELIRAVIVPDWVKTYNRKD